MPEPTRTVTLTADSQSPLAHAIGRIKFLQDPDTVNMLLDEFQSSGMPMGSSDWALYCLSYLRELKERDRTLGRVTSSFNDIKEHLHSCRSNFHKEQRRQLTKKFQEESLAREKEAEERHRKNTEPPSPP